MGNLVTLQQSSNTISQSQIDYLNQAMQDAQNNTSNSLSNADLVNICMQNATTSLEVDYCKNTVASAEGR